MPNFPQAGVVFKDITPILAHAGAFSAVVDQMHKLMPKDANKILAIESRGFLLGSALAARCQMGVILARKPGKLPRKTIRHDYQLEYGTDALEIHGDAIQPHDRIVIVDDVLATGGTAHAAETLCRKAGGHISGHLFLIELKALSGRKKLDAPSASLFEF